MEKMKEALSIQELKALSQLFFNAGKRGEDFEKYFNSVMQGRYNKAIEQDGLLKKVQEMEREIGKYMDQWDQQDRIRAGQAMEDLRKIIITA